MKAQGDDWIHLSPLLFIQRNVTSTISIWHTPLAREVAAVAPYSGIKIASFGWSDTSKPGFLAIFFIS